MRVNVQEWQEVEYRSTGVAGVGRQKTEYGIQNSDSVFLF